MVTYETFLDSFLYEKKAQGLSPATLKSYEFTINKFLKVTPVITKQSFYEFINGLDCKGETKKHYARELRVFLYWLMEEEIIKPFKVSLPKCQEPKPRIPSTEEVKKLITPHKSCYTEYRMYVICNLVVATGIRARTIINLRVEDISIEKQQMVLRETKNKHLSVIPLNKDITMVLYKYIKRWNLTEWLFTTQSGQQMTSEGLSSAYERYAIRNGCGQHGIHSLRHYFATEATKNGMSPFVLQRVLGHSDLKVTMKYVNLVADDLREEMIKYNPLK